jgi:hypothetical protein
MPLRAVSIETKLMLTGLTTSRTIAPLLYTNQYDRPAKRKLTVQVYESRNVETASFSDGLSIITQVEPSGGTFTFQHRWEPVNWDAISCLELISSSISICVQSIHPIAKRLQS